jgi:glutamyl-tRNA reductase
MLRLHEVARITQQLSGQPLSAEQLAAIDRLTKSLTAKLLHPQIAALRDAGSSTGSKD